tara:strand:- start:869 stop:1279 length:411 start_codon:yes stop_codon:yes gene_type:complete
MNNWQKVINVSLAVIVTLLIYQNQQLKHELDIVKIYQSDDSEALLQLEVVKAGLIDLEDRHVKAMENLNQWQLVLSDELSERARNTENININAENAKLLFADRDRLIESSNLQKDYINDINKRLSGLVDVMSKMYR